MPDWNQIIGEIAEANRVYDTVRRKYLQKLFELTGRNTIIYYSGWLQKPEISRQDPGMMSINDSDMHGFMATLKGLDRTLGLDLIIHTPGGSLAATESIVNYLRSLYDGNMRAIVPQIAMSGGTMMALACREVVMGKHSSLGPIDPQFSGMPAHAIVEEFDSAVDEIISNPAVIPAYQVMLAKMDPITINEARKAVEWSEEITGDWMNSGMFKGMKTGAARVRRVIDEFTNRSRTKSHSRHISAEKAKAAGVRVAILEKDSKLQDAILSVHHAAIQTLMGTTAVKVIENQNGVAHIMKAEVGR